MTWKWIICLCPSIQSIKVILQSIHCNESFVLFHSNCEFSRHRYFKIIVNCRISGRWCPIYSDRGICTFGNVIIKIFQWQWLSTKNTFNNTWIQSFSACWIGFDRIIQKKIKAIKIDLVNIVRFQSWSIANIDYDTCCDHLSSHQKNVLMAPDFNLSGDLFKKYHIQKFCIQKFLFKNESFLWLIILTISPLIQRYYIEGLLLFSIKREMNQNQLL